MTDKTFDLTGLSPTDCPYDCNPAGCVITGIAVCGHPFKGGLQGALQAKPEIVTRFQRARKILHNKKLNLGGEEPAPAPKAAKAAPRKRRKRRKRAKPAVKAPAAAAGAATPAT